MFLNRSPKDDGCGFFSFYYAKEEHAALFCEVARYKDKVSFDEDFMNGIALLSYIVKNPKFKEEKEWRIIYSTLDITMKSGFNGVSECRFRDRNQGLSPYFEFEFPKVAVTEVILGPKNQSETRHVRLFLENHGYKDVRILCSDATYRG